MKLSLTCITGNCEKDIVRFLDAFQPYVDEIVMVRAIGDQEPDKTIEIAKSRGCITSEYFNAKKEWNHVDDFSAARNVALSLATGDWSMWADMDDICDGADKIKELLVKVPDDIWMVSCPYVVSEQGVVSNFRERFWRNSGKFKWINPIHENLVCIDRMPNPAATTTQFKVIHKPEDHKGCTQDRNLRILETVPEKERSVGHKFYYAQELIRRDDPRSIDAVKSFLSDKESNTPERFEMLMTLAAKSDDYGSKANFYLQAFTEDPGRAEPLYELAALSLACDNTKNALAYAEKMMACKYPDNPCWNHRKMFYEFWRDDLYWQCLRAYGDVYLADILRRNAAIKTGKPIISLIHATRGRAAQAVKARQNWIRTANHPERIEHIFVADLDDEESVILSRFPSAFMAESNGCVGAWNYGASLTEGEVLVQLSDDWKPFKGWDDAILDAIGDTSKPSVLAISDGHRTDDLLCMAIMTRQRYKDQGYMFHPEFFSMYSDNWFSECAFRDGVVIDARNSIKFEHEHPVFGKAEMDNTYARSNANEHYERGAKALERLRAGIKTSSDIVGWCDYKHFYRSIAKVIPDGGKFVEVGSWMGQSIICLAQELQNLGKNVQLYCVDTWKGEQNQPTHLQVVDDHGGSILWKFKQNIEAAGVSEMIQIIESDSAEAASLFEDNSIDGCYIDAAHDYESAKKDINVWYSKVKPKGIWAGHDYPWHEVEQAIHEHSEKHKYKVAGIGRVWIKEPEAKP